MSKKKDIIVNEDKKKVVNEEVVKEDLNAVENPIMETNITEEPIEKSDITEESIVDNTESSNVDLIDESINEDVIEDEIIESKDEVIEEPVSVSANTVSSNPKQRKIVIATPTYFVVEKDGSNVVIYEQNSYRRGDTVVY